MYQLSLVQPEQRSANQPEQSSGSANKPTGTKRRPNRNNTPFLPEQGSDDLRSDLRRDLRSTVAPTEKTQSAQTKKRKPQQRELALQDPEAGKQHKALVALYFELFEKARGVKPIFGSREGKAIQALLTQCGIEKSTKSLTDAYRSWWKDKVTIRDIAKDPGKFIGLKPDSNGAGRVGVQLGSTIEELADHAARVRAATGGAP
jgi:hypothetical protein